MNFFSMEFVINSAGKQGEILEHLYLLSEKLRIFNNVFFVLVYVLLPQNPQYQRQSNDFQYPRTLFMIPLFLCPCSEIFMDYG